MCRFCRFCKHSSLSMKIELFFISESFSRAVFMLSSFWWDFSAILNWKKNNSITRRLHHLMRVGTYDYVCVIYLSIYQQNFMKSYRRLNALSCFILLMTLTLNITSFYLLYQKHFSVKENTFQTFSNSQAFFSVYESGMRFGLNISFQICFVAKQVLMEFLCLTQLKQI